MVRLKFRKPVIYKQAPIFNPLISDKIYTIERIKKERYPYLYELKEIDGKYFYAWNLLKVDKNIHDESEKQKEILKKDQTMNKKIIYVKNAISKDSKVTRSKNAYGHDITYVILKDDQVEFIDQNTLKLYKKLFNDSVQYDDIFFIDPKLKKLKI